jgi:hypothetical protein
LAFPKSSQKESRNAGGGFGYAEGELKERQFLNRRVALRATLKRR